MAAPLIAVAGRLLASRGGVSFLTRTVGKAAGPKAGKAAGSAVRQFAKSGAAKQTVSGPGQAAGKSVGKSTARQLSELATDPEIFSQLMSGRKSSAEARGDENRRVAREKTPSNFSATASQPENFARLMGGNATPAEIAGENEEKLAAQKEEREQASAEATEKMIRMTGAVGALAGAQATLTVAVLKAPGAIEKFTRRLLKGQEDLRRFNGEINQAFAQLERNDMLRKREKAHATSGSTEMLADALDSLANDSKELVHAGATAINLLGVIAAQAGRGIAWMIKLSPTMQAIATVLNVIEENTRDDENKVPQWPQFLDDLADGKYSGKQRDRRTNRPTQGDT